MFESVDGRISSNWRGIKTMVLRKKKHKKKQKSESFTTHFIKDFVHFSGECVEIAVAKGFSFTASYVFQVWFFFRKVLADPYYNDAYIFCLEKEKKFDGLKPRVTNDRVLWYSKLHWFWKDCFHWLIIGRMFRKLSRWRIILRFKENDVGWRDTKMTRPGICKYQ